MGRQRKPQSQYRMFYKEHDHREIIMDDQYHGAIYIGDNPEHAWRKYKPCLLTTSFKMINAVDEPSHAYLPGGLISIDTENKYFSTLSSYDYVYNSADMFFGDVLYRNFNTENSYYGLASKNGYDWKEKQVDIFLDQQSYVGGYGQYVLMRGSNGYDVYDLDYNENNNQFIGPTLLRQWQPDGTYLGHVYNDSTKGALFTTYSGYTTRIILTSGEDFESQVVWEYQGNSLNTKRRISPLFYINNTYYIFIRHMIQDQPAPAYAGSYKNYGQIFLLSSTDGLSWAEHTVTNQFLISETVDDGRSKWVTTFAENTIGSISHMLYYHSCYYFYTYQNDATYTETQTYVWIDGHKTIRSAPTYTTMYGQIIVFSSDSLSSWIKHTVPQYIDVPFFSNSDIENGRHGIGVQSPKFSSIRYFLDGRLLRIATPPTNGIVSEQYPYIYMDMVPNPFGPSLIRGGSFTDTSYIIKTQIFNGKIRRDNPKDDEGIWLFYLLNNDRDAILQDHEKFHKYICVNFKDPLFQYNEDTYAYQISVHDFTKTITNSNVDPIDPSDYIFEQ